MLILQGKTAISGVKNLQNLVSSDRMFENPPLVKKSIFDKGGFSSPNSSDAILRQFIGDESARCWNVREKEVK